MLSHEIRNYYFWFHFHLYTNLGVSVQQAFSPLSSLRDCALASPYSPPCSLDNTCSYYSCYGARRSSFRSPNCSVYSLYLNTAALEAVWTTEKKWVEAHDCPLSLRYSKEATLLEACKRSLCSQHEDKLLLTVAPSLGRVLLTTWEGE